MGPTEAQTQRTDSCRKIVPAPVRQPPPPPTPTEAQYYSSFTMPPISLSLSLSHTNTLSHTRSLYLSVSLSLSVSLRVSLSLALLLSLSRSLSLSHSITHTHTHLLYSATASLQVYTCSIPSASYQYYRSSTLQLHTTGQHVVKTLRAIPLLQVTMSPPRHISYSLLPPTTGLQVNTSSKLPEHSESN